jgi:hypothetical protein
LKKKILLKALTINISFSLSLSRRKARVSRVARSKKVKKAKFGHKQFQKRPNPK